MARRLLVVVGLIGLLFLGGVRLFWPSARAGAEAPGAPALSGKPVFLLAKDSVAHTLEKPEIRQLGGRMFVVGRQIKDDPYKLNKPLFGGAATIWVPVDGITQLVELEPVKPEK
jgi:hypothetical protein